MPADGSPAQPLPQPPLPLPPPPVDRALVERDVDALLAAMRGPGTDEEALFQLLGARDARHREAIEERFAEKYEERWLNLRAALHDELAGEELQRALTALDEGRDPRAPQRGENMLDYGKGGGLGHVLRHFLTWYNFGVGGAPDAIDGLPRLSRADIEREMLPHVLPGDVLLSGNNGGISHTMMAIGDGLMIHSMATEKTMRGHAGRVLDVVTAPFERLAEAVGAKERKQGVFVEEIAAFFERFERDCWVIMRSPLLTPETTAKGIAKLKSLLGKPYDWDFVPGNDAYYCSELVGEFFRAALGARAPRIGASEKNLAPVVFEREGVVDPVDILHSPDLKIVRWNEAALTGHRALLEKARA